MGGTGKVSAGTPSRLRTFDPVRLADLEYRAWVGYYLRRWPRVLIASVGLVHAAVLRTGQAHLNLYREPEAALRPAAVHRARAMDLSDEWIRQGCQPDSRLLPLEHAARVRAYAALLAAVHH
jgi:hypothetical protein